MRHPAEHFIKFLILKDGATNPVVLKKLQDWGFLPPLKDDREEYFAFLRADLGVPPPDFNPADRLHRPSMQYLRKHGVYHMFFPTPGVEEAWDILSDVNKRICVEQFLMARLDKKKDLLKINRRANWKITTEGIEAFELFFWNVKALSFDDWGRFLFGRSSLYERFMAQLQAPDPHLAFFHLRIEQQMDSKKLLTRSQEIAFFTLEEVNLQPGASPQKVKSIGLLVKTVIDCHNAMSTNDMAINSALERFEQFRMVHPEIMTPDIRQLAVKGNYTGSGVENEDDEPVSH